MISFTLKCGNDHQFDSWFQSGSAFDTLKKAGHVACPICGDAQVEKALMAPRVTAKDNASDGTDKPLSKPSEAEIALRKMRDHVEQNSEYVGPSFAAQARAMHDGDAPERAIYGEARMDEAKKLIDDGVPVLPLPFNPNRKTN